MKKNIPSPALLLLMASLAQSTAPAFAEKAGDPLKGATAIPSPFKGVCEDTVIISNKDFRMNEAYWRNVQANCGQQSVSILPDSTFLSEVVDRLTSDSKTDNKVAADFLETIGKRTLENLDYNNKVSEVVQHCTEEASRADWFAKKRAEVKPGTEAAGLEADLYDVSKCDDRIAQLKSVVKEKGSAFRVSLEMARRTAAALNKTASGLRDIFQMTTEGEKVPLSAEEKAMADKLEAELVPQAKKAMLDGARRMDDILRAHPEMSVANFSDPSVPQYVVDWVKSSRSDTQLQAGIQAYKASQFDKFFKDYTSALGDARILAFLSSREPTTGQIGGAAVKLLMNGQQTRKEVEAVMAAGAKGKNDGDRAQKMVELLKYGAVARDLLKEDPSKCAVAGGIAKYIADSDSKKQAYVMAGVAAAGMVAPIPVAAALGAAGINMTQAALGAGVSLAVGSAANALFLGADYVKAQRDKSMSFNYAHGDQSKFGAGREVAGIEAFQESRNNFAINAGILAATAAASAGSKAIPAIYQKFFAENAAKLNTPEVLNALRSSGMSEVEAKSLLRDFGSKDVSVAKAAAEKLTKALGVDAGEIKNYQTLVQKHLLDPNARMLYDDYSARLLAWKKQDPAVRDELFRRSQQILEMYPDSLTPHKRADALRLALAASEAGVKDRQQIAQLASHVKDWDDKGALYGLAKAFDKASELMKKDSSLNLEAAFPRALEELGVKDTSARNSMIRCAIGDIAK